MLIEISQSLYHPLKSVLIYYSSVNNANSSHVSEVTEIVNRLFVDLIILNENVG